MLYFYNKHICSGPGDNMKSMYKHKSTSIKFCNKHVYFWRATYKKTKGQGENIKYNRTT